MNGWRNITMYFIMIWLWQWVMSLMQLTKNIVYQRVTAFQQMIAWWSCWQKYFRNWVAHWKINVHWIKKENNSKWFKEGAEGVHLYCCSFLAYNFTRIWTLSLIFLKNLSTICKKYIFQKTSWWLLFCFPFT